MGVPMVNKCCFCATLHTGTLIIGYAYSVSVTIVVFCGVWALLELTVHTLLATLAPLGKNETVSTHKYVLFITAAVVSGVHLLCSILLVAAAYKKLASLTLPWTIVTGLLTAVSFIITLTALSLVLQDESEILEVESIIIVVHLVRACISVYCIVVVHSRHKQIMYEKDAARFQHSARMYQAVSVADHDF